MRFPELYKVVPVMSDGDLAAGANLDTDSINMKNFHYATFIISWQTIGVADPVLYVYSSATNGGVTSALTFHYAYGGAAQGAANCDVLAAAATSVALTVTQATYSNYLLVVEVDAAAMDTANNEEWLTLRIVDVGGTTGNVSITAILEPRYTKNVSLTALT